MNMLKVIKPVLNGVYFAFPIIITSRYFRISKAFIHDKFQNRVLVVHASLASALTFPRTRAAKQGNISGLMD